MIPFDLQSLLHDRLLESRRPPDGLLHASGDLLGSLRHAQLRLAGAPTIASEIVSDIRLMTGTMWHTWVGESLERKGIPVMREVKLDRWLPEGWSGTADLIFFDPDLQGYVLVDLKTIKGEGMRWILKEGAKEEHLWQVSAYWHALYDMGLPMVKGFAVVYWPMNDTSDKDERIEPSVQECDPLPKELVWGVMADRWKAGQEYLDSGELPVKNAATAYAHDLAGLEAWITDKLAPEQERVQKFFWDGKKQVFDLKLVPHWSAQFCPYDEELCACSQQGTTKIGHFTLDGEYVPRRGYENEWAMIEPSELDYARKRKEIAKKEAKAA
jgi:hypothetical protein